MLREKEMAMLLAFWLTFCTAWATVSSSSSEPFPREELVADIMHAVDPFLKQWSFGSEDKREDLCHYLKTKFYSSDVFPYCENFDIIFIINGKLMMSDIFDTMAMDSDSQYYPDNTLNVGTSSASYLSKIPLAGLTFTLDIFTINTMPYGIQTAISDPGPSFNEEWQVLRQMSETELSLTVTPKDLAFVYNMVFTGLLELSISAVKIFMVFSSEFPDEFKFTTSSPAHCNIEKQDISELVLRFTGMRLPEKIDHNLDTSVNSVGVYGVQKMGEIGQTWLAFKLFGDKTKTAIFINADHHQWTGFATESFTDISFSELYPKPTDIENVPYFGSAIADGLAYIQLSTVDKVCGFPKGMLDDVLLFIPECVDGTDIKATFDDVSITALTCNESDSKLLLYPVNNAITMREILKIHAPDLDLVQMNKNHDFFFDLRTVYNLVVEEISLPLDPESEEHVVCIDLIDNKEMSFFFNLLVVQDADIKFCLAKGNILDVGIEGVLPIDNVNFTATVKKTGEDYTISASAKEFSIDNVINHFRARYFPRQIREALKNSPLSNFPVHDPLFIHHIPSPDKQVLEVGGKPAIDGYTGVVMDAIILHEGKNNLTVGIFIENVPMKTLLCDITQVDLAGIPVLDQDLEASVVISPATLNAEHHHLQRHPHIPINKGITVEAKMSIPDGCQSNPFCKVAKNVLGDIKQFTVKGTMSSTNKEFILSADSLDDIDFTNNFILRKVRFNVTVGQESSSVDIVGSLEIPQDNITLTAEIEPAKEGQDVELHLSMSGCWGRAFGQDWLEVCNMDGYVDIDPAHPELSHVLDIGCDVKFGNKACFVPLVAAGHVGVEADRAIYFHAEFLTTKVRISSLVKALCWDVALLGPLRKSRFLAGFISSFSYDEQTHPEISAGYHFKGILEIAGLLGHADVSIDLHKEQLLLNMELQPLSFDNGVIEMHRSQDDRLNGPILSANEAEIVIEGFVTAFGSSVNTSLKITETTYEFKRFHSKLANLYDTYMTIYALHSESLLDAVFKVDGHMDTAPIKTAIFEKITKVFKHVISDAETNLKAAKDDLELKQQMLDHAEKTSKLDRGRVFDAHGEYHASQDGLADAHRKVETAFSRCPKWVHWGCKSMTLMAQKHLEASKLSVEQTTQSLEIAKANLNKSEHVLDRSKKALKEAEDFLAKLQKKYKLAMRLREVLKERCAMDDSQEIKLEKIMNPDYYLFTAVDLVEVGAGSFKMSVDVDYQTCNSNYGVKNLELHFNLNDLMSVCKDLVEIFIGEDFGSFF